MQAKILIAACLVSQLVSAQTEQKKVLPDFTKLNANVSTTIFLQKSDTPFVCIKMESGESDLKSDVVNGTLMLRSGKSDEMPTKVTVGYVSLNGVEANGAVSIKSIGIISAERLEIEAAGAAKCKLDLSVNSISANISGAATTSLFGVCGKMEAIVSGAASLKTENLVCENANISTSGAANAKVNVTNRLEGNASGASTLKYGGNPKETQINQSGASSVKKTDGAGSAEVNGTTEVTTTKDGDTTKRYTINGRYEIIVHNRKPDDTSTVTYKKHHRYAVRKKNWAGIDLFENGYLTPDNDISLPAGQDYLSLDYGVKNMGCNLNLFEKDFRLAKGKLQFVTGLGFSWNSYALKNKTVLNSDSAYTGFAYNTAAAYSKNKLKESWITVPLLFELNTSKRDSRNFHIAFGVIGGAKLGSSTKQYYTMLGHDYRDFKKDDYNLFPFKLDATVRVGYGAFTMFATYSLTPLFEYAKGPELYPFTVGVRIVPF